MSNLSHSRKTIFIKSSLCYVWSGKWFYKTFSKNALSRNAFCFFKIGVIINFLIFTRKYLCWSLFLIKLQDWLPATLLKKRPQHQCFAVNITKCMRKTFFMEHLWKWLKNFQEFLKAVLHRTICMIRLIWMCKLWNCNFLYKNLYDTIFKRSDEFYLFRFAWRDFKTQ